MSAALSRVDSGEFGVRVASYGEILQIKNDPRSQFFGARVDSVISRERLDRDGLHVLMPVLANGYREEVGEASFRCYLWFLEAGKNARSCVLIDVPESHLSVLRRLSQGALEKIVLNLLGELPIEMLP
jgi:hypothetical protein